AFNLVGQTEERLLHRRGLGVGRPLEAAQQLAPVPDSGRAEDACAEHVLAAHDDDPPLFAFAGDEEGEALLAVNEPVIVRGGTFRAAAGPGPTVRAGVAVRARLTVERLLPRLTGRPAVGALQGSKGFFPLVRCVTLRHRLRVGAEYRLGLGLA